MRLIGVRASQDRKSAILGMLEADEEDGPFYLARVRLARRRADSLRSTETTAQAVDALLVKTTAYQDAVAERRRAEEEANSPPPPGALVLPSHACERQLIVTHERAEEDKEPGKKLTSEQEARRKAEFLKVRSHAACTPTTMLTR